MVFSCVKSALLTSSQPTLCAYDFVVDWKLVTLVLPLYL